MVARPRRPLHSKRWWVAHLGIDPIQFGAVIVLDLMVEADAPTDRVAALRRFECVGKLLTGPVIRETLPFLAWSIAVLALAIIYPPITTRLPGTMRWKCVLYRRDLPGR
jgi:TRAP-type C4-dicarboxylate transport system permease large subunit